MLDKILAFIATELKEIKSKLPFVWITKKYTESASDTSSWTIVEYSDGSIEATSSLYVWLSAGDWKQWGSLYYQSKSAIKYPPSIAGKLLKYKTIATKVDAGSAISQYERSESNVDTGIVYFYCPATASSGMGAEIIYKVKVKK